MLLFSQEFTLVIHELILVRTMRLTLIADAIGSVRQRVTDKICKCQHVGTLESYRHRVCYRQQVPTNLVFGSNLFIIRMPLHMRIHLKTYQFTAGPC